MKIRFFFAIGLFILGALAGAAPATSSRDVAGARESIGPPGALDLQQALRRALELSPDYDTAVRTEKNARLAESNAWSAVFPQLDARAAHQYEDIGGGLGSTATHAPWSNLLTLTASENLYDNGESWRKIDVARLGRESGTLALERARAQILVKVAKAFYDYSVAVGTMEIERDQIDSVRKQFHTIEGRYRQGASSSRDYLRIKAQLQQAEIGLTNSKFSVEDAKANLRVLLGERGEVEFAPVRINERGIFSPDVRNVDPEMTLDFRIAQLQDRISDLRFRSVEREDWPRLSLNTSYTYGIPQYIGPKNRFVDDPNWDLRAALVLDYSLWDWGQRRRNVEIADNQRRIEYDSQTSIRVGTAQSLSRLRSQLDLLRQSLGESQEILKSNTTVYANVNRDYQEGKVSYLELITSLNDLYATRLQLATLQFNFLKARTDWAYYRGNLDEVLAKP